jgi:hypothetical protein
VFRPVLPVTGEGAKPHHGRENTPVGILRVLGYCLTLSEAKDDHDKSRSRLLETIPWSSFGICSHRNIHSYEYVVHSIQNVLFKTRHFAILSFVTLLLA